MPFKRRPLKVTGSSVGGRKKTRRTRAVSSPVVEHREGGESLYGASETPEDEELEGPVGVAEDLARVSSGQRSGVFRNVYSSIKERDIKNWIRLRRPLLDLAVSLESHPPELSRCRRCFVEVGNVEIYRCKDCGPVYFVCLNCLKKDHALRIEHYPEKWNVSSYLS